MVIINLLKILVMIVIMVVILSVIACWIYKRLNDSQKLSVDEMLASFSRGLPYTILLVILIMMFTVSAAWFYILMIVLFSAFLSFCIGSYMNLESKE